MLKELQGKINAFEFLFGIRPEITVTKTKTKVITKVTIVSEWYKNVGVIASIETDEEISEVKQLELLHSCLRNLKSKMFPQPQVQYP